MTDTELPDFRVSNYECPTCGGRLEGRDLRHWISQYRCPTCGWWRSFDGGADEIAGEELERYER